MIENENNWEQPTNCENANVTEVTNDESANNSNENGSQFGKFTDADSLLSGYNNLQQEFTRKCQKLSELTKQIENQKQQESSNNIDVSWDEKVSQFLKNNEQAKEYAEEISEEILNNEDIKNNSKSLELAWAKVVQKHYVSPQKIVEDQSFIEDYVLKNEEIKRKILEKVVLENKKQISPPTISASLGGNTTFGSNKKTTSFKEAKLLVEEMFNIKGE